MRKWLWIVAAILACVWVITIWFYFSAKSGFAKDEQAAIERALQESSLTEVDHVEFFAGAMNYTIVFGNNNEGEKLLVWVGQETLHEEKASEGVSKSAIRAIMNERHGSTTILRITPGELNKQWIWEVFYKKPENNGQDVRYYYDFYTFNDGVWLDTYQLSLED